MRVRPSSPRPALVAALGGLLLSLPPALQAQDKAAKPGAAGAAAATASPAAGVSAEAVAACERAARQALSPRDAAPSEVSFKAAPAAPPGLPADGPTVLRGEGRVRSAAGARSFSYSCNLEPRSAEVVGVVVRDTAPAAPPAPAPAEPDLSQLSPAACESSAAVALKQRWPAVSQISFDSATRRLMQDSAGRAELRGQGRALPTPDAPSTHFGFDCEIDPRSGRVMSTRISG